MLSIAILFTTLAVEAALGYLQAIRQSELAYLAMYNLEGEK